MATLSKTKQKKLKKIRAIIFLIALILNFIITPYLSAWFTVMLKCRLLIEISYSEALRYFFMNKDCHRFFFILQGMLFICFLYLFNENNSKIMDTETIKITEQIAIPVCVGNGQHGTSRFMTEEEKKEIYVVFSYSGKKKEIRKFFGEEQQKGGLVIQMTKNEKNQSENIMFIAEDFHTLVVGATRSGKTRRMILESIWLSILAGESMVISDPKGELFYYTKDFAEKNGFEVIDFDLRKPRKSKHYNYMKQILDALEEGDVSQAIDYTWDLVSIFVGEAKGEPLWTNGESAAIAATILIIAIDAPKEFRNLTNVYYFLAFMCETKMDEEMNEIMLINDYLDQLEDTHPAKGVFAMARIAPGKTRGSFFSSALGTLKHFTNWNIAELTGKSDYNLSDIGTKKTILYLIIPDEKKTLYSLVSIKIKQIYTTLVKIADENGGRLPIDVNMFLDEFGNFPTIPDFDTMLSVGAGRGIRFNIVIQNYQQLEKRYKNESETIKGNCMTTLYLKSPTLKTLEELSKRTGNYTVEVSSVSNSISEKTALKLDVSHSNNANMAQRNLLTPEEVSRIKSPYALCLTAGEYPAIMNSPDLSQYRANKELELGSKKQNQKLIIEKERKRSDRKIGEPGLWGIWKEYQSPEDKEEYDYEDDGEIFDDEENVNFLEIDEEE